jgi:hypothetical protein
MGRSDEQAVQTAVETFLAAVGCHDLDAVEQMVVPSANIGWASLSDGTWTTSTMSVEEWLAAVRARVNPTVYTEPVMDWTIHVDGGHLAFVRADATLFVGEEAKRHNIDYFTLIKTNGLWKFLTLSYVGTPVESE